MDDDLSPKAGLEEGWKIEKLRKEKEERRIKYGLRIFELFQSRFSYISIEYISYLFGKETHR